MENTNENYEIPKEIIDATINGDLVLFCGAGISTEGGILPNSFYTEIKNELNENSDIPFSSMMQKYCNTIPNGRKKLISKIRERFGYIKSFPELDRRAGQFHFELSEIYQIKNIVTTNWDDYFERNCGAIPYVSEKDMTFWDDEERNVLKIHGTISNIESIVATEDDYEKCYKKLETGLVGAKLKDFLARKTVVFVGFSFGDEDLNKIIEYLRTSLEDLYPHIYLVTLDNKLKEKTKYENCTELIMSGVSFITSLKKTLIKKKELVSSGIQQLIEEELKTFRIVHSDSSNINLKNHPLHIYCLAYQDGIIHCFERYMVKYVTGEYNVPGKNVGLANQYEKIKNKCLQSENYWDASYYEGYLNGLLFIEATNKEEGDIPLIPFFYLPSIKDGFINSEEYPKILGKESNRKSKYTKKANEMLKNVKDNDVVVHHPPF